MHNSCVYFEVLSVMALFSQGKQVSDGMINLFVHFLSASDQILEPQVCPKSGVPMSGSRFSLQQKKCENVDVC